jgi:hypothetical protein
MAKKLKLTILNFVEIKKERKFLFNTGENAKWQNQFWNQFKNFTNIQYIISPIYLVFLLKGISPIEVKAYVYKKTNREVF